jgi:tetratricopeptide (TPR) repeat protein
VDLTTMTLIVLLTISGLGVDAVWHPSDVILEGTTVGKIDKVSIDENMVNTILKDEAERISETPSMMAKPAVQLGSQGGIGMAIATAANMQAVAYALQKQVGTQPDRIKIALFDEGDTAKVLVTGTGRHWVGAFEQEVEQQKGETVIALLHRAALVGMARIDPYLTALNLMQRHASDKDFSDVESLIIFAKSQLPPTPRNTERSQFENLQGILALFRGNQNDAHSWFQLAAQSDPDSTVAMLNLAFADLQLGHFHESAESMEHLLRRMPPPDNLLVSTAYVTWAAAQLGLHDVAGADRLLAKATEINPGSATAWALWSDVKLAKDDSEAAARLHQKALEASASFENYAEIATLYFQLAWRNNQPVSRSMFANPATVSFH